MSITNSATVGDEDELWDMADALRGNMDAAEYKHVVLGLIFLKYVSDTFEETRAQLQAETTDGADPEHPDECRARCRAHSRRRRTLRREMTASAPSGERSRPRPPALTPRSRRTCECWASMGPEPCA